MPSVPCGRETGRFACSPGRKRAHGAPAASAGQRLTELKSCMTACMSLGITRTCRAVAASTSFSHMMPDEGKLKDPS